MWVEVANILCMFYFTFCILILYLAISFVHENEGFSFNCYYSQKLQILLYTILFWLEIEDIDDALTIELMHYRSCILRPSKNTDYKMSREEE